MNIVVNLQVRCSEGYSVSLYFVWQGIFTFWITVIFKLPGRAIYKHYPQVKFSEPISFYYELPFIAIYYKVTVVLLHTKWQAWIEFTVVHLSDILCWISPQWSIFNSEDVLSKISYSQDFCWYAQGTHISVDITCVVFGLKCGYRITEHHSLFPMSHYFLDKHINECVISFLRQCRALCVLLWLTSLSCQQLTSSYLDNLQL